MIEDNLIFIISQPRSGSTFLQNLLSNNTAINTCSEPWILLNYLNQIKPELVRTRTDNYLANNAFKDYLENQDKLGYAKAVKKHLLSIYEPLLDNYQFVIDKTPRYWEILDEIIELFPKSKVIVLHRNPIHVAESIVKTWGLDSFKALNLFRRDLLLAPRKMHTFCNKHRDNPHVYSITYENLIANQGLEIEKLYHWIGVPYDNAVLDTSGNKKYKGNFGDPFQNSKEDYSITKRKNQTKTIPKKFEKLILGYGDFLGKDFLQDYGYYNNQEAFMFNSTKAFNYFLHLGEDEKRSFGNFKSFKWFLQNAIYKMIYGD